MKKEDVYMYFFERSIKFLWVKKKNCSKEPLRDRKVPLKNNDKSPEMYAKMNKKCKKSNTFLRNSLNAFGGY